MKEYKPALLVTLKNLISAPFAGAVVLIVCGFFTENPIILYGIPAVVTLLILAMSLGGSGIKFTISEAGEFCYYKRNKLKERFDLRECYVGYRARTDGMYLDLQVVDANGEETILDGEPLGNKRFFKMYEHAKTFAKEEEVMKAAKKEG